ncbi:hypothetical protein BDV96DRAFT_87035 [Lophiotrema nucula]|uniref:Uncharacterized protein n=1 Tax=Lophiotrema nucula TaxID=690887 RepID=A0A6A5Z7Y1_9PLEO|nr:hypothetical protein BDV96DRAFT_87035 [Lophiotrema nucula]
MEIHREGRIEPFRFLDLPQGIRLFVYGEVKAPLRHHTVRFRYDPRLSKHPIQDIRSSTVTLVTRCLPTSLLRTCQLVNTEFGYFIAPLLSKQRSEPMRFLINVDRLNCNISAVAAVRCAVLSTRITDTRIKSNRINRFLRDNYAVEGGFGSRAEKSAFQK